MKQAQNFLFDKETVFILKGESQEEIFRTVANDLLEKDLVTDDFLENLLERENNFPTGIDLSVIDPKLPNIAIPHTEIEFVKTKRIIPIRLIQPIAFQNMIQPDQSLEVSFLFMILNDSATEQSNMLADIMDYLNQTDPKELGDFFESTKEEEVYEFLVDNF